MIFLKEVFSVRSETQASVPGVPCRVQQLRFTIKLEWSELQEQELPSTVSQHEEVCQCAMSFGLWTLAFPLKGLVSTRLHFAEHNKDLSWWVVLGPMALDLMV